MTLADSGGTSEGCPAATGPLRFRNTERHLFSQSVKQLPVKDGRYRNGGGARLWCRAPRAPTAFLELRRLPLVEPDHSVLLDDVAAVALDERSS